MNQLEIVQDIYAAFGRGDVPAILGHLQEDIEWEYESRDHGIPWILPGRGHERVREFFKSLQAIDLTRFELVSLLEGPTIVAAIFRVGIAVRATGKAIDDLEVHLWSFGPTGKIARFRHVLDTRQHVLAAS